MTEDVIALLVDNMERMSHAGEYEEADYILGKIREELGKPELEDVAFRFGFDNLKKILDGKREPITIKETYNLILGNSIRLNPGVYPFSKLLKLTLDVHKRLVKIKNPYKCSNDNHIRKIVAEEMNNNKITVPASYRGIKPNRAFLDIALKVNPSICKGEIERREKVNLWKAVETGNPKKIEIAKRNIRKIHTENEL